jgi:hypothetical protein
LSVRISTDTPMVCNLLAMREKLRYSFRVMMGPDTGTVIDTLRTYD